jgi:hypothetical protein
MLLRADRGSSALLTVLFFCVDVVLHRVLLHLARNDYSAAFAQSHALLLAHPSSLPVVNNFAVVSLYYNANSSNNSGGGGGVGSVPVPVSSGSDSILSAGGMGAGIQALEGLIRADPTRNLTEATLSNLRALYDLSSSNPALKRRMLDGLVLNYGDDSLDAQ